MDFVSEIPEDALETLCECCAEFDIDPLSSIESETYFHSLVSNFQGTQEELASYLKKKIKLNFCFLDKAPEWLQGCDWQFYDGKPMYFVGQLETMIKQDGGMHSLMFYVFWDMESGETRTILQSD